MWGDTSADDEYEQDTGGDTEETEEAPSVPDRWPALPRESDFRERQSLRRTQGQLPEGWYWSDPKPFKGTATHSAEAEVEEYAEDSDPYGYDSESYGSYSSYNSYSGGSYGQQPWIRWVYAVLLLLMSMPFIISVLENLFNFWRLRP